MAKNDLKLPISVCFALYFRNCRSYQDFDNDIYRCFSLFFFKKHNIVNIKMILLFIGPLEQFLNNYLFFKFITKCQKEILRHAPPSYVCDFLFHCLAWKHFTVYIIRETSYIIGQTSLMVRLKNMILWGLSVTAITHSKWKVSFTWYQAAMILKPWYGACLVIYIMSLYVLLFALYIFYFPDQYSQCNLAFSSLTFNFSATSTNGIPTIWGKRIMDHTHLYTSIS